MSDQAESLRRLVLEANRRTTNGRGAALERAGGGLGDADAESNSRRTGIVAVVGATPRVGVTSLAVELALTWTRSGVPSAIVDAHRQRPAVHTQCDISSRGGWLDVVDGRKTLREVCTTGPSDLSVVPFAGTTGRQLADGIDLPPETLSMSDMLVDDHPALGQLARFSQKRRTVVDVGDAAGLAPYLALADHCVFVTEADDEAVFTCYAAIKTIAAVHHRATLWLVCNKSQSDDTPAQLAQRLQVTCDRCLNLELGYAGNVPYDSMELNHGVETFRRREKSAFADATRRVAKRIATRMAAEQAVALTEV